MKPSCETKNPLPYQAKIAIMIGAFAIVLFSTILVINRLAKNKPVKVTVPVEVVEDIIGNTDNAATRELQQIIAESIEAQRQADAEKALLPKEEEFYLSAIDPDHTTYDDIKKIFRTQSIKYSSVKYKITGVQEIVYLQNKTGHREFDKLKIVYTGELVK
jgi:hypothetical protein